MKKVTSRKQVIGPPPSKKPNKAGEKKLEIQPAHSFESIFISPTRNATPRKASTPTHDRSTALFNAPNISCISNNGGKPNAATTKRKLALPDKMSLETSVSKESPVNLQEALDFEYTQYLQAALLNKMEEERSCNIEDTLNSLQSRIAENQKILNQTTERLKNIKFNREVDMLHTLHNPKFGEILETVKTSNCEAHMSALNAKIEQNQNRLKVKNIELQQDNGEELLRVVTDTVAALEKLKTESDLETPKILKEVKEMNKVTNNTISRCVEILPLAQELALRRASYNITSHNELD